MQKTCSPVFMAAAQAGAINTTCEQAETKRWYLWNLPSAQI